ncbi:MAG: hypothetical protein IJ446_05950 [Oscillospiraceae bacterium]|nr:hypothetical protein [Oscillospiraceae bacterium]
MNETENKTATPELNEDGVPRPAPDPNNGLYTFISLLIFAVLYFGGGFLKTELFTPYSKTAYEFSAEISEVLINETSTPLPQGASISHARLNSTDDPLMNGCTLHIWYKNIGDTEEFADMIGFEYGDVITEERTAVYKNDGYDVDYVYADKYISTTDPGLCCLIYEYEDILYAEFRKSEYDPAVRSAFENSPKIKNK